jgi:hypothetical protein
MAIFADSEEELARPRAIPWRLLNNRRVGKVPTIRNQLEQEKEGNSANPYAFPEFLHRLAY